MHKYKVKVNDEHYLVIGSNRSGYDVYKCATSLFHCRDNKYLGRSQCDTPRMAVNDVIRNSYRKYY